MDFQGSTKETGKHNSHRNTEGRIRGRGGLRGTSNRGTNRGAGREDTRGAGRGANSRNRRINNWTVSEFDSDEPATTEYRDVEQICDGFNGRTVFNQKLVKTKSEGRIRTEYRGTRRASHDGRGRGRGTRPFRKDTGPISFPAKTSDFHTENTTEVYDFSNFSADDFEKKPGFRGRGSRGRGSSTRGFRATRGSGPTKRNTVGNNQEREFGAKRFRQDEAS